MSDLDVKLAERTVEMIKAEGGTAVAEACDATQEADCKRLVDAAVDRWGRLDFLDNNVGIGSRGSVVDEKPEEYRRVMQVNVETMFLLSKHAIPAMIKTAKGGAIVNISSISALRPRGLTTYTVSKAAVIGLTQAMAVDHGKDNIRVNCICPGPMYTPMVNRGNGMSEANRAQRANASVLKIEGTGWDIGQAVRFLMSQHARYITGQVLVVDGGVTLQGPERDSQRSITTARGERPGWPACPISSRAASARTSRHAQAADQPARGCWSIRPAWRAPSTASAATSATRARSIRACANSRSCRSAGWRSRNTNSPIM